VLPQDKKSKSTIAEPIICRINEIFGGKDRKIDSVAPAAESDALPITGPAPRGFDNVRFMNPEPTSTSKLSRWLDQLQQESWQLELLISGFAIFLLIGGLEPYHALELKIQRLSLLNEAYTILQIPYQILRIAYYILLASLLLHVMMRGLWISTIGLRYVSGDIDFKQLSFAPRFSDWLGRRIGTFDEYIERLERICSVVFGYTFLLIFSIISSGTFLLSMIVIQVLTRWLTGVPIWRGGPGLNFDDWAMLAYFLLGLIYLIDFVTLGWIKRQRRLSAVYYPIYRLISFVTFANLYRPIYYNLIDNRFGRRLAYWILPVSLLFFVGLSARIVGFAYLSPFPSNDSAYWYLSDRYVDESQENTALNYPSLESRFVASNYLRIFLPYLPYPHDATIEYLCPEVEPGYYTGLKFREGFSAGEIENFDADSEQLLACMRQLWQIHIDDSLYQDIPIRFYEHPVREQPGLEAVVPIHDLAATEHVARIDRLRYVEDSLQVFPGRQLYFYKE
jgi:hypothetical protein